MAAFAVVVCATAVCTRETSVRVGARAPAAGEVRARRWRRKPVHAEPARFLARKALARNRVPATMPSQWPACWLVLGASRVQLATRKPVEEVAQAPRRMREMVGKMVRMQSRVRELALEAQNPRRRQVLGQARELLLARKFVPVPKTV